MEAAQNTGHRMSKYAGRIISETHPVQLGVLCSVGALNVLGLVLLNRRKSQTDSRAREKASRGRQNTAA